MSEEKNKKQELSPLENESGRAPVKHKLSDRLAFNRTKLANERTMLAYIRTAIGSGGAGMALFKLIEIPDAKYIGIALVAAAPVILVIGILRFIRMNKKVDGYKKIDEDDED